MKLIKIPWDNGSMNKNPGCKQAPDAIIKELDNLFLNEAGKKTSYTVSSVNVQDDNFEKTNKAIYEKVKEEKENAILIGGDHSITYAAVKAFAEEHTGAGVLMIDAHPDCESDFLPPTHEDFIRGIINQNIIPKERILIVGIRNWHEDEETYMKKHKIPVITMKEIGETGIQETTKKILASIQTWESVYTTIDIDAVDPAYAPGTGYTEVGGMSSRELINLVQTLKKQENIKMYDLVEINPKIDTNKLTVKLGAKIVNELL